MAPLRKWSVRRRLVAFLILLTLLFSFGCFHEFYRANQKSEEAFRQEVRKATTTKYFIVHGNSVSYHLTDISLTPETVSGSLEVLPDNRLMYEKTDPEKANRYRGKKEGHVLDEVHIWLRNDPDLDLQTAFLEDRAVTLQSEDIDRIEFYERDRGATAGSHTLGVIGVVAGIAGFVLLVALIATSGGSSSTSGSSSCPFVYTFDGQGFQLQGELFAGAMLPNLERDDYLLLAGQHPENGLQSIRLRNELREVQYVNQAELIAVNHEADTRVLLDGRGYPHTIKSSQTLREASIKEGQLVTVLLDSIDGLSYLFNDFSGEGNIVDLTFDRPPDATQAKLLLRAKNTRWVELMWYEFNRRYGSLYEHWFDQLAERPPEELLAWMESQQLLLTIELWTPEGWLAIEHLPFVGPLAMRDIVVPVDLGASTGDLIKLRLRSGFLFWEIDYVAMDFSEERPVTVHRHRPQAVNSSDGINYTTALATADTSYLRQPEIGDQIDLLFPVVPVEEGQLQTLFLHGRGYYQPIRDFSGFPELLELRKFDQPNYFSVFSKDHFRMFLEEQNITWQEQLPSQEAPVIN